MKHVQKTLMCTWWCFFVLSLIVVVLGENDIIPGTDNAEAEFLCHSLMVIFTIASVPLALRMFKTTAIAQKFSNATDKSKALLTWGMLRLIMLGTPMLANTLLYYIYSQTSFGYMAIILLLASLFVYPTMARCEAETEVVGK